MSQKRKRWQISRARAQSRNKQLGKLPLADKFLCANKLGFKLRKTTKANVFLMPSIADTAIITRKM